MADRLNLQNIWQDDDFQDLNERGKLALLYVISRALVGNPPVAEDMALATGLDITECEDWIDIFIKQGKIVVEKADV